MTESTSATRQIEISDEAYDLLARTAASRGTDLNGALLYLMRAPAVPAAPADRDEEGNEEGDEDND